MTSEQMDRFIVGWSREQLAQASGVSVASVYLLERMGTAGPEDDLRMREALAREKSKATLHRATFAVNERQIGPNN